MLDDLKATRRKLHSIFVTRCYVSVPALGLCYGYFGWLTTKTAWGKFVFFLFSQSTEEFGKVDILPKTKSSHLNISRNPKGPKDRLPTSPSVTIKLRVEALSFGGVKNLKTDQTQSCFLGWAPWKPFRAFCWGMWRWWWPWRRATWQDSRWNSPQILAFFQGFSYNAYSLGLKDEGFMC